METRLLTLALPSALILAGLVWHSMGSMPQRRAVAFWAAVVSYGVLRGLGVRYVTSAIDAPFPYEIRDPILSFAGISAQEIAGWALVSYLAWWIGWRFSLRARRPWLFLQIAWASLFLGSISWAIEAAAIAARWWHWTVPTASRVFLNVPAIGIVDWFFVGIDFLLPFVAISAPALSHSRWRYGTLLLFPAHFAGHLLPGIWLHVVHWMLVGIVVWLALRLDVEDEPFNEQRSWLPSAGFAVIAADIAVVDLALVGRPELLQSLVPAIAIWLTAIRPAVGTGVALLSLLASVQLPSLLVATATTAGGALLLWLRKKQLAIPTLIVIALFAGMFHRSTALAREDLTSRLDHALAERARGGFAEAVAQFDTIARDHPTSHVPFLMAAEIDYRRNNLDAAYGRLERVVEIKQDFLRGYRLLAAIDHQKGRRAQGRRWAERGLEVARDDLQLRYLAGNDVSDEIDSAETAAGMAALAFETGDVETARRITDRAIARWPGDPRLHRTAARIALSSQR